MSKTHIEIAENLFPLIKVWGTAIERNNPYTPILLEEIKKQPEEDLQTAIRYAKLHQKRVIGLNQALGIKIPQSSNRHPLQRLAGLKTLEILLKLD